MSLDPSLSALESALSVDINEIADLPDYVTPPPGLYKIRVKEVGERLANEKLSLSCVYEVIETIELANPEEDKDRVVAAGSLFSDNQQFTEKTDMPMALGMLKKKFGHFGEAFGTTNLKEILMKLPACELTVTVTNTVDKDDKTKVYARTKDFNLA